MFVVFIFFCWTGGIGCVVVCSNVNYNLTTSALVIADYSLFRKRKSGKIWEAWFHSTAENIQWAGKASRRVWGKFSTLRCTGFIHSLILWRGGQRLWSTVFWFVPYSQVTGKVSGYGWVAMQKLLTLTLALPIFFSVSQSWD